MPHHACGINGYYGTARGEAAGLFGFWFALLIARVRALGRSQQVYDRDCPESCDTLKNGLVSFRLIGVRLTGVPVSPPPGVRRRLGWLVRIQWRLWVACTFVEGEARRDNAPVNLPWGDLEALFSDHYHEPNLDRIDTHLQGIGT